MIALLRGTVLEVHGNQLILDVHGVGFEMFVTGACLGTCGTVGEEVSIHTYMQVKDDGVVLFGFAAIDEKDLFRKIISVSGAGPKTALAILTALRPVEFVRAIQQRDAKRLTGISGVGKKTAERLILELADAAEAFSGEDWVDSQPPPVPKGGLLEDASEALQALGYSQAETDAMLQRVGPDVAEFYDLQALLKAALTKQASKRGR